MPVRPILRFPDPRLSQPAEAVTLFDAALAELAADLLDTIRSTSGVGITGPHIGVFSRVVVLELPRGEVATYVNPRILALDGAPMRNTEGSISMPGVTDEVERPERVTVAFQTLSGEAGTETATGFRSACLQHEIDQLDGIFWTQRLSRLKRERLVKRYEKLHRGA
jgi:peptide deformylase